MAPPPSGRVKAILVAISLVYLVAAVAFARGLFVSGAGTAWALFDQSTSTSSHFFDAPDPSSAPSSATPAYERIVVMVIDALRWSFALQSSPAAHMPFLLETLVRNNQTLPFVSEAAIPTVTLPRIKAITGGYVPGFADIALNFGGPGASSPSSSSSSASRPSAASWVEAMAQANKRLLFFGDDTWLRLFPNQLALHDGTTSFFVKDYTEVDQNVTRHVQNALSGAYDRITQQQLAQAIRSASHGDSPAIRIQPVPADRAQDSPWDGIVLHYLGVDHIGHSLGPQSAALRTKLAEMDGLIRSISVHLASTPERPTLLVVCGDHGMNELGNHGGSSALETHTAAVFYSPQFLQRGAWRGVPFSGSHIRQVDIAPTLSAALGLPIPALSVGRIIEPVVTQGALTDAEVCESPIHSRRLLHALSMNADHLLKLLGRAYTEPPPASSRTEQCFEGSSLESARRHYSLWRRSLSRPDCLCALEKLRLVNARISEEFASQARGQSLPFMVLGATVCSLGLAAALRLLYISLDAGDTTAAVSANARQTGTLLGAVATIAWYSSLQPLDAALFALACLGSAFSLKVVFASPAQPESAPARTPPSALPLDALLIAGLLLHPLSMLSSSFVEEEYLFWYYFVSTVFLVLLWLSARKQAFVHHGHQGWRTSLPSALRLALASALLTLAQSVHSTGFQWISKPNLTHWLSQTTKTLPSLVYVGLLLGFALLILAQLDFSPTDQRGLAGTVANAVFRLSLAAVVVHRVLERFFVAPPHTSAVLSWFTLALLGTTVLCAGLAFSPSNFHYFRSLALQCAIRFVAVFTLIHSPPTNIIVLGSACTVLRLTVDTFTPSARVASATALLYSLGYMFHFAHGNSNGFGTLDLAGTFATLDEQDLLLAGLTLFLSCFSAVILAHLFALHWSWNAPPPGVTKPAPTPSAPHVPLAVLTVLHGTHLLLTLVAILVHRHHLFIWSVYAPKLTYVLALTLLHALLSVLHAL